MHLGREEEEKRRLHPKYRTLEYYFSVGALRRKEKEGEGREGS